MLQSKKIVSLIILFFFFIFSAVASDFVFEFMPYMGITYAQFDENIYSSSDNSIMRSKLEWEEKPLTQFGLNMRAGWRKFSLEVHGDFGLPLSCGTMRDSDWNESGDLKYIYSLLEEKVEIAFNTSAMFSYGIELDRCVKIAPAILMDYSHTKIKGSKGEGWFASSSYSSTGEDEAWDSGYARYYGKGKLHGINYERYAFNFFAGFKVEAQMTKCFSTELGFFVAPFSYISVFDTHLNGATLEDYQLNEYAEGYFSCYKLIFRSQYDLTKKIAINLSFDFTSLDTLKDSLYHNYYSEKPVKSNQQAGTSAFSIMAKLGIKFKICN